MAKRAVIYARVSGNDRVRTGGENLQGQIRLCREYANKQGYHIITELAEDDRGASGATFDLPELSKALNMARASQFDILIVRELDRLSRDLAKQLIVEQELMHSGVSIEYVLYDFPDTPEGRLNKNLRAMLAEYEREKITQRMTRGKKRKVESGEVLIAKRPPFGYKEKIDENGRKTLEIDEEEAEIIRLIYQLYTVGNEEHGPLSIGAIARKLTDMRVATYSDRRPPKHCTTKTINGYGEWNRSSVIKYLTNATYIGTWKFNNCGDPITVKVPQIVDIETWKAAQKRRSKNKHYAKRNHQGPHLLRYRVRCFHCNYSMAAKTRNYKNGRVYNYYVCHAPDRRVECPGSMLEATQIDEAVWNWICTDILQDPVKVLVGLQEQQAIQEEALEPLRAELRATLDLVAEREGELKRLLPLYLKGTYDETWLGQEKSRIDQELTKLRYRQSELEIMLNEQTLTDEAIQSIVKFAQIIRQQLDRLSHNEEDKRHVLNMLNVQCELERVDRNTVRVHAHCILGDDSFVTTPT